jgi:RsiW-degrading membrane proteinase PrsW (M82 family)
MASGINTGEDFRQALGGASGLGFTAVETILEFKQGLADGIRE